MDKDYNVLMEDIKEETDTSNPIIMSKKRKYPFEDEEKPKKRKKRKKRKKKKNTISNIWDKDISKECKIPRGKPEKVNSNSWFTITRLDFNPGKIYFKKKYKMKKVEKETLSRCYKLRIYPNKKQKEILKHWFGTSRFIYNKTIEKINKNYEKVKKRKKKKKKKKVKYINQIDTINKLIGKGRRFTRKNKWLLNTPSSVKSNSIRDAFKARKTCFTNLKRGNIKHFKLRFRRKKDGNDYITIRKQSISKVMSFSVGVYKKPKKLENNELLIYKEMLGHKNYKNDGKNIRHKDYDTFNPIKIYKKSGVLLKNIDINHDCKILKDKTQKYWLLVPYDVHVGVDNKNSLIKEDKRKECVALDPGIRSFQAYYSKEGVCGEIGKSDVGRIKRLLKRYDKLKSKICLMNNEKKFKKKTFKKYKMKLALRKINQKIKNLVGEVHKKSARFLTSHFKRILLPVYKISGMMRKKDRNIPKMTARLMSKWCPYQFKERLLHLCKTTNTDFKLVTEENTSKTCGHCGMINPYIKKQKVFKCPYCDLKIDRDINGARNVMIKWIKEQKKHLSGEPEQLHCPRDHQPPSGKEKN